MVSLKKKKTIQKRAVAQRAAARAPRSKGSADFLPLDGGPGKNIKEEGEPAANKATVVYIGRIPHGFYEEQMKGFFSQFGTVKRLRISRSKKTGNSKHFGFIEFENPDVAKIVADEMNNYVILEHTLKVHLVQPEKVHPKIWRGVPPNYDPMRLKEEYQREHNKEKTLEEHQRLVKAILKRDRKRRKKLQAAGIDYDCPDLVHSVQPLPKKIKFAEE